MAYQDQVEMAPVLPEPRREERRRPWPEAPAEQITVLCISENVELAKLDVVPPLREAGLKVELWEADARKPLNLDNGSYGLIVLDVSDPEGPGYEICMRSRHVSRLPIMLVLRGAARDDVLRVFQAGADAYVVFPFDPREFLARLGALLRRRPQRPGMV
jgi:two-component system OmpR family response regulator